ncbi:MAG: NRDE family protein [Planctomycetes bacterium]|nr:NRDE family protein [Planctomycetota bacterium]
MCTVTIIPVSTVAQESVGVGAIAQPRGIRLACNRDELRGRPAALPPVFHAYGTRKAIMPIDPVSDGTWIAVNNTGIAATLLNVNLGLNPAASGRGMTSRGTLIPRLMVSEALDEAIELSADIDPSQYAPFRLVVVDDTHIADVYSDGQRLRIERSIMGGRPILFTSSGLGDALVESPRRELFEQMFTTDDDWPTAQDAYHRHSWPDRRHVSVCMERSEARTVSHTVIEIEPDRVALTYVPDAPDRARPLVPVALIRLRARI